MVISQGVTMSRLTKAWAIDSPKTRKERRQEAVQRRELARLVRIQASEMKHENLNRRCGD